MHPFYNILSKQRKKIERRDSNKVISIKKSIFNIEYAKMVLNLKLEHLLGVNFTSLELKFNKTQLLVKVYTYYPDEESTQQDTYKNLKKQKIISVCKEVLADYCSFNVKVLIIKTLRDIVDHPKYYFRLLLKKCKGRTHPFNALSKLEKINLHPKVKGLLIRIKGKRGARKDKKILLLGNPCRHSNKKDKVIVRDYLICTAAGTMGVKILVAKNEDLRTSKPITSAPEQKN